MHCIREVCSCHVDSRSINPEGAQGWRSVAVQLEAVLLAVLDPFLDFVGVGVGLARQQPEVLATRTADPRRPVLLVCGRLRRLEAEDPVVAYVARHESIWDGPWAQLACGLDSPDPDSSPKVQVEPPFRLC